MIARFYGGEAVLAAISSIKESHITYGFRL
jgi:hypothetical protein